MRERERTIRHEQRGTTNRGRGRTPLRRRSPLSISARQAAAGLPSTVQRSSSVARQAGSQSSGPADMSEDDDADVIVLSRPNVPPPRGSSEPVSSSDDEDYVPGDEYGWGDEYGYDHGDNNLASEVHEFSWFDSLFRAVDDGTRALIASLSPETLRASLAGHRSLRPHASSSSDAQRRRPPHRHARPADMRPSPVMRALSGLALSMELASRDLTPEDYELLQSLDATAPSTGTSPSMMASLPTRRATADDEQRMCHICLSNYKRGDDTLTTLPCLCSFHSDCIRTWLKMSKVCPMDKTEVAWPSNSSSSSSSSSSSKGGKKHAAEASPHSPAALATLGLAIVSMGEDLSRDMSKRMFEHLLAYGDVDTRRAVPLAMALTHLSNPEPSVVDVLGKLSHDSNAAVAQGAALALGLVGAGTNNARIGQMLRALAAYRHREPAHLFAVRVAQGLLHLGKGTMTLSPFQSHKLLPSRVALAGLLVAFHSFLDLDGIIMGPTHFIMYALSAAMRPRFVMTVDEEGNELHVPVRVGDAVDTVGQAGKRKQITGFQTRSTPVLLSPNERCELATDEYLSYTPVLEGIVVLRVNSDAPEKTPEEKKQEKDLAERREEAKRKARERRDRLLAEAAAKEEEEDGGKK